MANAKVCDQCNKTQKQYPMMVSQWGTLDGGLLRNIRDICSVTCLAEAASAALVEDKVTWREAERVALRHQADAP